MEERRKLIVGNFGEPKQERQKIEEAITRSNYAIEQLDDTKMYPKHTEQREEIKK